MGNIIDLNMEGGNHHNILNGIKNSDSNYNFGDIINQLITQDTISMEDYLYCQDLNIPDNIIPPLKVTGRILCYRPKIIDDDDENICDYVFSRRKSSDNSN